MNFFKFLKRDVKFNEGEYIDNYRIKKKLGEGRYGIAYLAESSNNKLYTIKQLKNSMLEVSKKKVFFEPNILKKLNSLDYNYFPKYINNFTDKLNRKGYILEYIEGETFSNILHKQEKVFNKIEIYKFALELIKMVTILESINVIHKDIRITNVIYTPEKEIKLIDFGLARYIDNKKYKKELDYWYIADFLIHLHYSDPKYAKKSLFKREVPWYNELNLTSFERDVLMRLMGIDNKKYDNINDIKSDIQLILKKSIQKEEI